MSAYAPTALQRRGDRAERAGVSLGGLFRTALSASVGWLYPQAADVVAIERLQGRAVSRDNAADTRRVSVRTVSGDTPPERVSVREQVDRWRWRVGRARAAHVLGRHLAVALALTAVGLVVARIATSGTTPAWAFAGAALVLVSTLIALAMPITYGAVAGMLDRELGLFERVQTALELDGSDSRLLDSRPLTRYVIAESRAALSSSFATARARPRNLRPELAAVVVLAVAVALLVVLPGASNSHDHLSTLGRSRVSATTGTVRGHGVAKAKPRRPGTATLPVGAAVDNLPRPALAIAPSTSKAGKGGGPSPYGNGAKSYGKSEITKTGLSDATASTRVISAPGSASGLAGSKSSSGASTGTSGSAGSKTSSKAGSGGLSAPGSAPTIAAGSVPKGSRAGGTPGSTSSSSSSSQSGGSQSQKAPPGGEKAGSTLGSSRLQAGLAPDLPQGDNGLPLQAGYAPSAAQSAGHGGISQTPNGGGGRARSAAGGSASGGSGGGRGATAIQPTANTSPAAAQSLLSNYFGGANQLTPGSW